jgi:choline kinase
MSRTGRDGTIAILLAAGIGKRLQQAQPKILSAIGGKSLLVRHLERLAAAGVDDIALTIGHQGETIRQAVAQAGFSDRVRFVENDRYRDGSLISLWLQREGLRSGRPVLLMDGDVIYDGHMLPRLLAAPGDAVLLVDRAIEPGDEPVKVCFRGDKIVDFRKRPEHPHDWHGESVGFFRFSHKMATALADRCDVRVTQGPANIEYEEAIRDLILEDPLSFQACDVSDLPWTEIDFPEDLARAREEILPRLDA